MTRSSTRPVWPAYAIALIALVVSVGGPSYAAGLITGDDVKDASLTGRDVRDGSLKGIDVKDGSIGLADLLDADEAALDGTSGACPEGHEIEWLAAMATGNGMPADTTPTFRLVRCVAPGVPINGDDLVQATEECDDGNLVAGDGCTALGEVESPRGLDLFYAWGPE